MIKLMIPAVNRAIQDDFDKNIELSSKK